MGIPTFTQGYPPDQSSLGQTKATIRNNLDGTFETLGIDHVNNNGETSNNLTGKPAGYHNIIRSVPQSGNPTPIAGYGQLYCKVINDVTSDTALFWETGAGLIQQMTANVTPQAASTGYSFIPGGVIIQWGQVTPGSSPTSVSFPLPFPSNVFSVVLTINTNSPSSSNATTNSINTSGFQLYTTRTGVTHFYIAIGN